MTSKSDQAGDAFIAKARQNWLGRLIFGKADQEGSKDVHASGRMFRRQGMHANVVMACGQCGAPGRYLSDLPIQEGWPGCYVSEDDERRGQEVGEECPNCGHERPAPKALGEIWHKEYR